METPTAVTTSPAHAVSTAQWARLLLTLSAGAAVVVFSLVLLQIWHASMHTAYPTVTLGSHSVALRALFELAGVIGLIGLIACAVGAADCYVLWVRDRDRTELEHATERSRSYERRLQQVSTEVETLHARLITSGLREPVTGLPNRKACLEAIDRTLARMRHTSGRNVAVLALGFDKLQRVADAYGYSMVDRLLLEAARRVEQLLEPQDFLSRIGDTQLALVVTDVSDANGATTLANLIGDALRQPCEVDGRRFHLDHGIGVACADSGHECADQILDHAILAMHETRDNNARRVQVFHAQSADELEKRLQLEADLRHAVDREEFTLWYQPVFEGVSTGVAGFEALLRWNHPREGLVLPGRFLGIAHEMGLMGDITHWLLREVSRQAAEWQGRAGDRFFISANLTAESFIDPGLVGEIAELLVEYQIPARRLKLEIVETTVVADVTSAAKLISALRDLGIVVWLDDFGTGYSSLSYLRALAFQGVKLDRSFVARMAADSRDFGLVKSIIDLLHYLEMSCVAEGVETPEQRDLLRMAGCDLFQGYLLARPMPAHEAGLLLPSNFVRLPSAAAG